MGAWLSRWEGRAPAPETPHPTKLSGQETASLSAQLVTQTMGARHAPAARPLPRAASSRPTTRASPPPFLGLVALRAFPRHAVNGARFFSVSTVTQPARSP